MLKKLPLLFLVCFLIGLTSIQAQEIVQGQVTDIQSGEILPGVNIVVKGTTQGTTSDGDGDFEINVQSLQDTLVFSFIGYQTQEVPINNRSEIDVTLQPQVISGDEVVVVGYGEQARTDVTSSISTVDVEETIGSRPISDLGSGLQGAVSSLTITTPTGEIGSNPEINLRGMQGSLNSSGATPLILVDGVEVDNINQVNTWADGEALAKKLNSKELPGLDFEPATFTPQSIDGMSTNPKLEGEELNGIRYQITEDNAIQPVAAGIHTLLAFYQTAPDSAKEDFFRTSRLNTLAGSDQFHDMIKEGKSVQEIIDGWEKQVAEFKQKRQPYLIY